MARKIIKFGVGIDLGAKYTGVFIKKGNSSDADASAFTIVMPEGDKFGYSTKNRTAVRHRLRGVKRFKLARRLLVQLVNALLAQNPYQAEDGRTVSKCDQPLAEALSGLLRRRGYSRVETEIDLSVLNELDGAVFAAFPALKNFTFLKSGNLLKAWEDFSQDVASVKNFAEITGAKDFAKDFVSFVKTNYSDYSEYSDRSAEYRKGLEEMRNAAEAIHDQKSMGHLPRVKYLEAIKAEIARDTRLIPAVHAAGGAERLWKLVGNVSNFQLRAERHYFDDARLAVNDVFRPNDLRDDLVRSFKYFHGATSEERDRLAQVVSAFQSSKDIVATLCELDPELTIQPYEDQNNRRPPNDQTLLLNPAALDRLYPDWRKWEEAFAARDSDLEDGLKEILSKPDRRSWAIPQKGAKALMLDDYRASYVLQRVLDRVKDTDEFAVRRLARMPTEKRQAEPEYKSLSSVLKAESQRDEFLKFAGRYYSEVDEAKNGIWFAGTNSLLEISDIHPQRKKHMLALLIGNILSGDESRGRKFIDKVWNSKYSGRSSVRSFCMSVENTRKDLGNSFNHEYQRYKYKCEDPLAPKKATTAVERSMKKIADGMDKVVPFIAEQLGLSEKEQSRIANPFQLSQLYNLIENDPDGFSATTRAVHLENNWRMTHGKDGSAVCSRLSALPVRPFDGVIRKALDRQAWELASRIAQKLRDDPETVKADEIDIGFMIEQNRFSFSADLAEIKKNKKKQENAAKGDKNQQKRWLDKDERIKQAARGICAYTGRPIDKVPCEIDHIMPRSATRKFKGAVYNSEMNLIYVSREGNQLKKEQEYFLDNLNDAYLDKVFGTADRKAIQTKIEDTVERLNGRIGFFDGLETNEQDCVRHALFLPHGNKARNAVESVLARMYSSRVNGTQAWFVRNVISKLTETLETNNKISRDRLRVKLWKVSAEDSSSVRRELAASHPEFEKSKDPQPVASHAIDAMCVYASAGNSEDVCAFTGCDPRLTDAENEALASAFPSGCDCVAVSVKNLADKIDFGSRALFKEGIYADQFLPILVSGKEIRIGFDWKNSVKLEGKAPTEFVDLLRPYLDGEIRPDGSSSALTVNKGKAFVLFEKTRRGTAASNEMEAAKCLQTLEYFTQKTPVEKLLFDKKGILKKGPFYNNEDKKEKNKKPDPFDIAVSFSCGARFKASGKVKLPAKADWIKAWRKLDEEIRELEGKGEYTPAKNPELVAEIITRGKHSHRKHAATRRVFSLPVVAGPSGGIRIRRRAGDGYVYQVHAVNSKVKGFAVTDKGQIDWKKPVIFEQLNSGNATPTDSEVFTGERTVELNQWKKVMQSNDGSVQVWMCPGTNNRRYVKLEMPFESFKGVAEEQNFLGYDEDFSAWKVLPHYKTPEPKKFAECFPKEIRDLLGKPRSELFIISTGKKVGFWYIPESSSAAMNDAYRNA